MIVYDLACGCGFIFEGWFLDRDEFLRQQEAGLLSCPRCGGNEIRKILSPVSVCGSRPSPSAAIGGAEDNDVSAAAALAALRTIQRYVEKNFEDVGTRLAEESLKIHYGVEEPRNIRGVVTAEEEKTLEREGIELLKVPIVSEEDPVN
jgi:hypothetical protein